MHLSRNKSLIGLKTEAQETIVKAEIESGASSGPRQVISKDEVAPGVNLVCYVVTFWRFVLHILPDVCRLVSIGEY